MRRRLNCRQREVRSLFCARGEYRIPNADTRAIAGAGLGNGLEDCQSFVRIARRDAFDEVFLHAVAIAGIGDQGRQRRVGIGGRPRPEGRFPDVVIALAQRLEKRRAICDAGGQFFTGEVMRNPFVSLAAMSGIVPSQAWEPLRVAPARADTGAATNVRRAGRSARSLVMRSANATMRVTPPRLSVCASSEARW